MSKVKLPERAKPPVPSELYMSVEVDKADFIKACKEIGDPREAPAKVNLFAWVNKIQYVQGMELSEIVSFLKVEFEDVEVIKAFTEAYPTDDILEEIAEDDIIDFVIRWGLNPEQEGELIESLDLEAKGYKISPAENLQDVELQEAFEEAVKRCNPHTLVDLLNNAR